MSTYGSSAYGSDSYGGGGGNDGQTFFAPAPGMPLSAGLYRRTVGYGGAAENYAVRFVLQTVGVPPDRQFKVLTSTAESEEPQLQVTIGESLEAETVVGARAFITVEAEFFGLAPQDFWITGREVV